MRTGREPLLRAAFSRRVRRSVAAVWILVASGCAIEQEPGQLRESASATSAAAATASVPTTVDLVDEHPTPTTLPTVVITADGPGPDPRDIADESEFKEIIRPGPAVERTRPVEERVSNEASARGVVLSDGTRSRRSQQQFLAVETGGDHTCAITLDGELVCWGHNGRNQLEVPPGAFAHISVGTDHACAVGVAGNLACWGSNIYGRADAPVGEFVAVSAADDHSCALRSNGSIECWGWDVIDRLDPPSGAFTALDTGSLTSCGLRRTGSVECWGANWWGLDEPPPGSFAQISVSNTHACGLRDSGELDCWGLEMCSESAKSWEGADPQSRYHRKWLGHTVIACTAGEAPADHGQADPPRGKFQSVSVATWHSCGVRADGSAECWGSGRYQASRGAAGTYTEERSGISYFCHVGLFRDGCSRDGNFTQTDVPPGSYSHISIGDGHSCGLHADRTIECWGDNLYGEIDIPEPTELDDDAHDSGEPLVPYVDISVSGRHGCGLRADGRIRCWGDNSYGQLDTPDDFFLAVATGTGFTCGVRVDGTPRCWGLNDDGQGDPVPGQYTQLSADYGYACGLLRSGFIECWGDNWTNQANAPFGIFTDVSAGGRHSCGLRFDGSVECWGGEYVNYSVGAAYSPDGMFRSIATADQLSCGLRTDGVVSCWGWNSPVYDYEPDRRYVDITAGDQFFCGLHDDGTISCVGENDRRQTAAPRGAFVAVSSAWSHSCAVRTEGTIACWGSNSVGQSTGPGASGDD
ncbi:MAG: hypothetical protein OXI97_08390 [Acidimicrobiaceae bacterium]|nr:hypothetical protein [Acidimicrobiaceae bacterium]